jgi:hypothetical protein
VLTQVSLASGEPIATDVVVLGLMKAFRWSPVTTKGIQEHVQIQRAMAPGLGARGLEEVELVREYPAAVTILAVTILEDWLKPSSSILA